MALVFDASTNYITYADHASYTPSDHEMSVRALVYFHDVAGTGYFTIVSKQKEDDNKEYKFHVVANYLAFDVWSGGGTTLCQYGIASQQFSANTWYDVVVTYHGGASAGARVLFYVNGSLIGAGSPWWYAALTDNDVTPSNGTSPILIGAYSSDYPGRFFDGGLAEVSLWNVTLSGTQASNLYNSGTYAASDTESTGLFFYTRLEDKDSAATYKERIQDASGTLTGTFTNMTHPITYDAETPTFTPRIIMIS